MKVLSRLALYLIIGLSVWVPSAWLLAEFLVVQKPLDRADAIVVLGGSSEYIERADAAADLFKEGVAPKVFLTNDGQRGGWNQELQRNPYFVERSRWRLVERGVPADSIEVFPTIVTGTQDEAELFANVFRERGIESVVLVTSPYHSRRTLWTFERALAGQGLRDRKLGIQTAETGAGDPSRFGWWLSAKGWRYVGLEYPKTVYYWLQY